MQNKRLTVKGESFTAIVAPQHNETTVQLQCTRNTASGCRSEQQCKVKASNGAHYHQSSKKQFVYPRRQTRQLRLETYQSCRKKALGTVPNRPHSMTVPTMEQYRNLDLQDRSPKQEEEIYVQPQICQLTKYL